MKKTCLAILVMSLVGCAYNPVIDTGGRSGTFNKSKADKITDDVMLCKQLAKKHTNDFFEGYKTVHNWYIRPQTLWLMPKMEYKERKLVKNCLTNRGHSVLD